MTTPNLLVPDLSEWQGTVDWATLINAAYPAAIIRAHNGYRVDNEFIRNRAQAHAHGIRALGLYAYMVPGDPAAQAAAFVAAVGKLGPGEWPILDYEASGLHPTEIRAWVSHVAQALHGGEPWLYSSEYIYRSQGLAAASAVPATRTWLAAWGPSEPVEGHELWQYTDHRTVPGVTGPVDCSTFHGDINQLVAAVSPPTPSPAPPPAPNPAPAPKPTTPGPTSYASHPYPAGIHPGGSVPSARPLQQALKRTAWMDASVVESDHYGPITQQSVAGFNAKHGMNTVGVSPDPGIGPRGWALLMTLAYGSA